MVFKIGNITNFTTNKSITFGVLGNQVNRKVASYCCSQKPSKKKRLPSDSYNPLQSSILLMLHDNRFNDRTIGDLVMTPECAKNIKSHKQIETFSQRKR